MIKPLTQLLRESMDKLENIARQKFDLELYIDAPGQEGVDPDDREAIKVGVNYWVEGGEKPSFDSPGIEDQVEWDEVIDLKTGENISRKLNDDQIDEINAAAWEDHERKVQSGQYDRDDDDDRYPGLRSW
jgi:hypothetical protein